MWLLWRTVVDMGGRNRVVSSVTGILLSLLWEKEKIKAMLMDDMADINGFSTHSFYHVHSIELSNANPS